MLLSGEAYTTDEMVFHPYDQTCGIAVSTTASQKCPNFEPQPGRDRLYVAF
jgi:hypothetical protein